MIVRILISRAGHNWADEPGKIRDMDDSEALALIKAGQAEQVEVATLTPSESASLKRNPIKR